jgi:hypothetical protein
VAITRLLDQFWYQARLWLAPTVARNAPAGNGFCRFFPFFRFSPTTEAC